jgi:outer membrane protein assembly factor BamB
VVAYDKLSGLEKWKTPNLGNVGYVSPALVKIDGDDHVVMVTASSGGRGQPVIPGKIVGIDPGSGELLWEYDDWVCGIPVPSAIDAGNNRVLVIGGYELGAVMIKIEKGTDGTFGTTELFKTEEFGDQTKPAILHEGYFYAQFGTNNTRDGLSCMNMDGEIMWKTKRDPDFNKGSMILADGLILATDGATTLFLIEPDPSGFKSLASAELLVAAELDDPRSARFGVQNWAPIALADGKLLIRDQSQMLCVKVAE